jgi:hypothetical protein
MAGKLWLPGRFETSFPELFALTGDLRQLPLPDLVKYLRTQDARLPDQMQILGVQVPLRGVSGLGALALVIVQLHWWLHFRMLLRRLFHLAAAPPWIGLDPDPWCRGVFVLSGMLLPILTALLLQVVEVTTAGVLLTGISAVLSVATFQTWRACLNKWGTAAERGGSVSVGSRGMGPGDVSDGKGPQEGNNSDSSAVGDTGET